MYNYVANFLHQTAVSAKNCVAVEALIGAGANVNTLDVNGRTPLTNIMRQYVRVKGGECQIDPDVMTIIILLTQAGADLNLTMCEYSNPLIVAAFLEAEPLIHFFSDNGANPNIRCKYFRRVNGIPLASSASSLRRC